MRRARRPTLLYSSAASDVYKRQAGELIVASSHVAAVVKQLDAVGEGVLHGVGVEVLVQRIAPVMAPAQSLRFHRPGAFHPGTLVDLMDEVIAEDAAAGPQKRVEQADLVQQFGDALGLGWRGAAAGTHAIRAHRHDVADLAAADAVEQFLARPAVADHQPDSDLEVLLHGELAEFEHAAGGGTVHRDGLLLSLIHI